MLAKKLASALSSTKVLTTVTEPPLRIAADAEEKESDKYDQGTVLVIPDQGHPINCANCGLFIEGQKRCAILGPDVDLSDAENLVCAYWVPPMVEAQEGTLVPNALIPVALSGLARVKGGTHCEACVNWIKGQNKCKGVKGTLTKDQCCALWENPDITGELKPEEEGKS